MYSEGVAADDQPPARDQTAQPIRGLNARLQPGERVLWQGAPRWRSFALSVFHTRLIILYFAVYAVWQGVSVSTDGGALAQALFAGVTTAALGVPAVGIFWLIAWLVQRTTVYTITDRRVVFSIGVALPKTFNFPLKEMDGASLRTEPNGTGNISLALKPHTTIAYLILWPHVRPWRLRRAEPTLRAIPEAEAVARLLADAFRAATAEAPPPAAAAEAAAPIQAQEDPAAEEARQRMRRARVPLIAAASLVVLCAVLVVIGRFTGIGTVQEAEGTPALVYQLRFEDLGEARIAVVDAEGGETLTVIETGTDGLLRGALRGLTRSRTLASVPVDAPYQLIRWDTGRITLTDPETGEEVPLDAFGPVGPGAMADLMALIGAGDD